MEETLLSQIISVLAEVSATLKELQKVTTNSSQNLLTTAIIPGVFALAGAALGMYGQYYLAEKRRKKELLDGERQKCLDNCYNHMHEFMTAFNSINPKTTTLVSKADQYSAKQRAFQASCWVEMRCPNHLGKQAIAMVTFLEEYYNCHIPVETARVTYQDMLKEFIATTRELYPDLIPKGSPVFSPSTKPKVQPSQHEGPRQNPET